MRFDPLSLRNLSRFAQAVLAIGPVALSAQSIPPELYTQASFTSAAQLIGEHENASATVRLSQTTHTTLEIPFRLEGTATLQTSEDGEGDYYLAESTEAGDRGFTFDPATKTGTLIFPPGARQRTINFTVNNDFEEEENETIIVSIDPEEERSTIWQPVPPLVHTITIQDNDPIRFFWERTVYEVAEGNTVTLEIRASGASSEAIDIPFSYQFGTASEDDLARSREGDLQVSSSPVRLSPGQLQAGISFTTAIDNLDEDPEEFTVTMGEPSVEGVSTNFVYDERPVTVRIRDAGEVVASFNTSNFREEYQSSTTLREGEAFELPVRLSSRAGEDVELKFEYGGDAVRGDEEGNGDWLPNPDNEENTITIESGETSGRLVIQALNDMEENGDKTLTVTLVSATLVSSKHSLEIADETGFPRTYTITIEDNDPVTLGFGRTNPYQDSNDPQSPQFIDGKLVYAFERNGSITLPIYLTGYAPEAVTFDIEFLSNGTTATPRDVNLPINEHDWDFYLSSVYIPDADKPREVSLARGSLVYPLTIAFNNEREPALPYHLLDQYRNSSEPLPDPYSSIERDERIRLRISNVNTGESGVTLRSGATELDVIIKEMPDIDVTELYNGVEPATDSPERAPKTGLHELPFNITRNSEHDLSLEDFPGYRAIKLAFRPGVFAGRDDEASDPLRPVIFSANTPQNFRPDGQTPFSLLLDPPFELRYPTGTLYFLVDEGAERIDDDFFDEGNADVFIPEQYVLLPMNFPFLDDDFPERQIEGDFDFDQPLDFLIEFSGNRSFDIARLMRDDAVRIYVTAAMMPTASTTEFNGQILEMSETEHGEMLIEFANPSRSGFEIQYLSEDGEWKLAQPGMITSEGNRVFWKDTGPPKTFPHPSEVDFRVYRVTN